MAQLEPWFAFLPFAVLLAGLGLTRLPSYIVSSATLLLTLVLAAILGKPAELLLNAVLYGAGFALLPIVWVIFAAVFTYFVSVRTGAIETIKHSLSALSDDRHIQAVIIAFCFGGFLEGVAGFGTAVAIPTAMLISIGIEPVRAAVIALVANSVPVAFGALGIPVIALADITGLNLLVLTRYVALQLLPFALLVPPAIVLISNGGIRGMLRPVIEAAGIGLAFCIAQTATAFWIGPELVAVFGALGALTVYAAVKSLSKKRSAPAAKTSPPGPGLIFALSNYLVLFALVLMTRVLLPGLGIEWLKHSPFLWKVQVGAHAWKIDWLSTPGTLLFISAIAGALLNSLKAREVWGALAETAWKMKASTATIVTIVPLAYVMGDTGMIAAAAAVLAAGAGSFYPFFAPAIGGLGTFVTGSDTTSNILLGRLQKETALRLDLSAEWICASNTSGATAGKMISPQSIAVAAATTGIREEKTILQKTVLYFAVYLFVLGLFIAAFS